MKIGIVGNGYVGRATALLKCDDVEVLIYDIDSSKCEPKGLKIEELADCDYIFICVPTPMTEDGEPVIEIVEQVIVNLKYAGCDRSKMILKSTVPVGTSSSFDVMFMPEFLTEKNWEKDFRNQKHWLLGTNERNEEARDKIYKLFSLAYEAGELKEQPSLLFCSTEEAELIKYTRNCYLATKVSFFNEINELCRCHGISYDKVRELVCLDDRIESSHTYVPGPDGLHGFGGTCFPKDMNSLLYQMKLVGLNGYIVKAAIERNEKLDRPEKDWELNRGRAVI